ncbi:hypothetical protein A6B39_06325 [Mannheimia granulomatis]|uniref:YadA-like family protein n=1 Tax=Mannheimia granulomatis TaxID=85402 RepID=UPI00159CF8D8|nr:YadA-like family protein [Mannheimia granulomatis]QLB15095.1 hypothetical protein A6B39_06325 [Mannheimia granulomatis]
MNKVFKVIWNHVTQQTVVVSELAQNRGKVSSSNGDAVMKISYIFGSISLALLGGVSLNAEAAYSNSFATVNSNPMHPTTIALGSGANNNATALQAEATAIGGKAYAGGEGNALGFDANASGHMAIAVGTHSVANSTQSLAVGYKAIASGDQATALGGNTIASGSSSVAIGGDDLDTVSRTNTDGTLVNTQVNGKFVMNTGSVNTVFKSISGHDLVDTTDNITRYPATSSSGAGSVAIGTQAVSSGALGLAIGTSSQAKGIASTAIGMASLSTGHGSLAMGAASEADTTRSIAIGANAHSNGTANSTAIGTNSLASGESSIAFGTLANASVTNAVAIGDNANASIAGSIALGNSSTTVAAVPTSQGVVGGITYGNFAGNNPTSVVSIGAVGKERQIHNVAAGRISSTSTDAINGSQLYATQNILGNLANSVKTEFGGNAALNPTTGAVTFSNIGNTGKNTIHDAIAAVKEDVVAGTNIVSVDKTIAANGSTTYTINAKDTTASVATGDKYLTVNKTDKGGNIADYQFGLTQTAKDSLAKADTAVQSFTTSVNGVNAETINQNNNNVNFVNGSGTTARNVSGDITFDVNTIGITVNDATGAVTVPTTETTQFATARTVAEAINKSGFTVRANDETSGELINPGEQVGFKQGKNISVSRDGSNFTIATKDDVNFNSVTTGPVVINNNGINAGDRQITNVQSGGTTETNAANIADVKNARTVVTSNDNTVKIVKTSNGLQDSYDLSVNTSVPTTALTTNKGVVEVPADKGDSYVTAGNLVTTINNAVASAKEKVEAGTNIASVISQADQATGATTYTVNAKGTTASSANTEYVTVNAEPTDTNNVTNYKVDLSNKAKESLGKADTAVQQFTTAVNGATVDTINKDNTVINFVDGIGTTASNKNGDITFNVNKGGLTTSDKGNVTSNKTGDNFVTGDDVANAINDAVTRSEKTTTVVQGSNTHVKESIVGNNTEYTVSADKATVSVSEALKMEAKPTIDANEAVTTEYALDLSDKTKDDIKKGVDAKNIVDTKGLIFTADKNTATTEKLLGSSVAINGDNNITTEATADAINIKLNKDINVDSVTAGTTTTNNLAVNPNGNVDMGNNQITNVASGGDVNTNAANIADVKKAKTEVKAGTNIVDVVKTEGDNGQDIYTVNAKGTTATHASSSADFLTVSAAQEQGNNVKNFEAALTTRATDALKAAETAIQSFTTSVNGAEVETINKDNRDVNFVNGTGTTARNASGHITFDINKSTLTTDTAGKVTNNTAGDTFVTGDDVARAINEAAERTEKTTTVVKGSNTHIQSKVEGNNTEYTVSADKSTVSVSDALKKTETTNTDGTTEAVTTDYALDLSDKTKEDIKKGVDAKEIVDNKGLTFTGDSGSTNIEKLGSTVAVNGDKNITTEAAGDAINIKLKDDISVNSVTANTVNVGPVTINNAGINAGNKVITNVANGTNPYDAVNVSQLNAAKTEVTGTGLAMVTNTAGANGQTIYNVDVAKAEAPTVTRGNVVVKAGDENKVMTAGDVANAINGSEKTSSVKAGSDKVTVQAGAEDDKGNTEYTVDLSADVKSQIAKEESVTAGNSNLIVEQDAKNATGGNNYKVTLSNTLNLGNTGSVNMGDTMINNDGITINNGAANNPVSLTKNGLDNGGNKITNVANGTNPNDAVNLSQLQNQAAASKEEVKSDDKSVTVNTTKNDAGANVYDLSVNVDNTTITKTADGKLTASTTSLNDGDNNGKVDEPSEDDAEKLVNAGDIAKAINASGFKVKANGDEGELINPSDEVEFINGSNIDIKREAGKFTVATAKNVKFDSVTLDDNGPKITNKDGNINISGNDGNPTKITGVKAGEDDTDAVNVSQLKDKVASSKWTLQTSQDNGVASRVGDINPDDKVTFDGKGIVKVTNTVEANGESKVHIAVETQAIKVENGTATTNGNSKSGDTINAAPNRDALSTVGDVIDVVNNVSWTIHQGADAAVNNVKAGNEVHFVDSDQLTASVTKDGDNKTNVTFTAKTVALRDADNNGKIDAPVTDEDKKKLVTAENVANAINASGWNAKSGGNKADGDDATETLINPSEVVEFNAGDNLKVKRVNNVFTFETAKDVTFENVTSNTIKVPTDNADKPITINNNGIDLADKSITNLASNLPVTNSTGDTATNTVTQAKPNNVDNIKNNAATVNDVLNAGWNLQENGTAKDFVKAYDTVNFINGTGTTANVTMNEDGTVAKVKFDINTSTITSDANNGKATATTPNNFATAGDVAQAVNNAGFIAKATKSDGESEGEEDKLVKTGETVIFDAGKNIKIIQAAGRFSFATKEDVIFNSIQFGGNTGPKFTNDGDNIKVSKADGSPTKITNVAAGDINATSTDAVNGSQLYTQVMASREEVASKDKSVVVDDSGRTADGAKIFDLSVNTDNVTIEKDTATGAIKAKTTTLADANNDGAVDKPQGDEAKKLVNAGDIANAINNSGWKAKSGGNKAAGDEADSTLINPSEEVSFNAGDNLKVKRVGNEFTFETAKEVNFDKVTVGPVTIDKTDGINAGNTQIKGVKAGTDDTDAVNVSQLKAAQAAATTKVKGDQGVIVTSEDNADGSKTYTVAAKTDNTTVKVDDNGNISAVTSDLTNNPEGKVETPAAPNALVTAQTVADAINNAGFNLQANGDAKSLVKTGDTVQFLNGENIEITRNGNDIKVATAKEVTFDKVTVGPVTINKDSGINAGDTKITGVKAGTDDTDAVNVSQLNTAVAASKEEVKSDDKSVTVKTTQNAVGANVFDLSVNTDDVTITKTQDGKITANTTSLGDADEDGKVDAPTGDDAKKLVNAGDIATAINKAGFTLKTSAAEGQKLSGEDELINAGDVVDMTAGKNLTVKQEANGKVTYATKDDVTFNTVNSTTVVVGDATDPAKSTTLTSGNKGLDVGGDKITNVANGDISPTSTEVVNGSQLNNYTKVNGNNIGTDNGAINIVNGAGTTVTSDKAGEVKVNVNNTDLTVADNGTINVQDPNGTGAHYVNATTVAKAVNNVSWNVNSGKDEATANIATKNTYTAGNNKVKAGDTVKVNAGRNVEISGSGKNINVAVSDNPEFNTVKVGKGNNATTISSDADGVRIAKADGSPQRITNVAAGRADNDAVNVGQLKGAVNNLNNKINRNQREARAGIAGAAAIAGLPEIHLAGKSMLATAASTYKGENAIAVGYSRLSDNSKIKLKLSGSADTRGDFIGTVGVGYAW